MLPTLLAAADEPDVKGKLLKGACRLSTAPTRCTWAATT